MCKFFFCLSRIFLQELLQFFVFEFFWLARAFSVGKVKITIAKSLEQLLYTFYVSLRLLLRLSEPFRSFQLHFFSIEMQEECSVSNALCRTPLFSLMNVTFSSHTKYVKRESIVIA